MASCARVLQRRAMRALGYALIVSALAGCTAIPALLGLEAEDTPPAASAADAGTIDSGVVGGGCGIEQTSRAQLCLATSMCPTLVVDTESMPHCGFRLRGGAVDLVCACGTSLCSMGVFDTCAQAASLLVNQTEAAVCAQVVEGRCLENAATAAPAATPAQTSTSSTSGAPDGCDRQCVKDCGGGAACASVCNCS